MKAFFVDEGVRIYQARALEMLGQVETDSVSLVFVDPPYFRVKDEWWDRQWDSVDTFLRWMGELCREWARVLALNGSLYVCASPQMAARVEMVVGEYFRVCNSLVWCKANSRANGADQEALRGYFPATERLIFAEQLDYARGEAGEVDGLRISVFEPIRVYLDEERRRAGVDFEQVRQMVGCAAGSGLPSHWFTRSQWALSTAENYAKLQAGFNNGGGPRTLFLRREYEDLRREYEDLRRPFRAEQGQHATDVWTYETVRAAPGKHPCEKPLEMLRDVVRVSSRLGDLVLDCFMGRGTTAVAAVQEGRRFMGGDVMGKWCKASVDRLGEMAGEWPVKDMSARGVEGLPLFRGLDIGDRVGAPRGMGG